MSDRERRIAQNETTFRDANEDLRASWDELELGAAQEALFVCECGDPQCTRVMRLTLSEYERIRSDANTFAVLSGHDDPATERVVAGEVVDQNDRFVIVKKRDAYHDVTEGSDPRG